MNEQDLHKIFKELRETRAALPLHKEKLRSRLLLVHKRAVRHPFSTFLKGVYAMKKPILTIGLPVALVAVFAFLGLAFMNPQPATAQQLVEGASKATIQMSPEKLQKFQEDYKQNLKDRLAEAKADSDLKIMTDSDLKAWGFLKKPDIKTSVGYIDSKGHRIVIGLDEKQEPLFVYDVDVDGANPSFRGTSIQDEGSADGTVNLQHQ